MIGSKTDGVTFTVTPRGGKVFNLGRNGNLALFVSGNYLDSDLTVDGFYATPDGRLEFDYSKTSGSTVPCADAGGDIPSSAAKVGATSAGCTRR